MITRRATQLLTVDDEDSSLHYSDGWNPHTDENGAKPLTLHTSTTEGSAVTFSFAGTFIAVYGVLDNDPVTVSFSIDSNASQISSPATSPSPLYDFPFFSTNFPAGTHTLSFEVVNGTFSFDYLQYTSTGDPSPGTSPVSSSSSPSPSKSASPQVADSSVTSRGTKMSPGAIAVVGRRRKGQRVRHRRPSPEKPIEILPDVPPKSPPTARRGPLRALSRIYRPTAPRSAQSSKTQSSGLTQSSGMFTSILVMSPALSMVSEETRDSDAVYRV
ncbi:uncharacterized protein BXZ73DRAFT_80932 [Epithele typhae]|uniref:uncharacterized protein n=1 Tax=Epithele typhae TaxID=378194 RepID=UPI0020081166|nr:uncharacterized protein BXZ73DRAFT_80932 [Epithele typhae]KAH9916964.1 hypothetical protein BXZ73DRAFT_80932 [Epithele typhae]